MKGKAPNCSAMGSHTRVKKKLKPNLCRGSADSLHNSNTSSTVITTTDAAHRNVKSLAISSPSRRRETNEREATTGPALGKFVLVADTLLDLAKRLQFLRYDFRGELCVCEGFCIVLPVGKHPLDKSLKRVSLPGVGKFTRDEQPGKTRYRIDRLARCIGDRYPEILRHRLDGTSSCATYARQIRFDEVARGVLHLAIGHLVLNRVNQFNVSHRIRGLLDQTRNAFVALATKTHRPVDGCALADFVFPIDANFRQVVRPDIGGSAAIRPMNYDDIVRREIHTLVDVRNGGIVPLGNISQKDSRKGLGGKIQLYGNPRNVVRRDISSQHSGKMQNGKSML